jgi:hypothetical protein
MHTRTIRAARYNLYTSNRPPLLYCHCHRTLIVWHGLAVRPEQFPGTAPFAAVQLGAATPQLRRSFVEISYPAGGIGCVDSSGQCVEHLAEVVALAKSPEGQLGAAPLGRRLVALKFGSPESGARHVSGSVAIFGSRAKLGRRAPQFPAGTMH